MNITCMILHHDSILTTTRSFILRSFFQGEEFEIEVINPSTTAVFLRNADKDKVRQAVMLLESEGLTTVYHFSDSKDSAYRGALQHLPAEKRSLETGKREIHNEE